jgi:uncharacterized membrane protein
MKFINQISVFCVALTVLAVVGSLVAVHPWGGAWQEHPAVLVAGLCMSIFSYAVALFVFVVMSADGGK